MALAAGKTAPRLLQDLLTYDPRYEERAGRNLLTTAPPEHNPSFPAVAAVPYRNCRHALVRKDEQSQLPVPGDDPTSTTVYKIASYCPQCNWHFDVIVDFRHPDARDAPCRKAYRDYPLHHFLYTGEDEPTASQGLAGTQAPRTYNFRCTAPRCPVTVRISLKPPRFSEQDKHILTNQAQLRRRWEITKDLADRADTTMARPVDAPDFLNTYLQDSLNPVKGKARIPLLNRKFLKTFGRDCDTILRRFGFVSAIETEDDGTQVEVWHLPKPDEGHLFQPSLRSEIEDARYELNSMILAIPESERTGARHKPIYPAPSQGDIERALACHDCMPNLPCLQLFPNLLCRRQSGGTHSDTQHEPRRRSSVGAPF
jgi:ubiquitin carboxyl-terminal hydrolase 25/28